MAEQAESIDNPMHEAAKRGVATIHKCFYYCILCVTFFIRGGRKKTLTFFCLSLLKSCCTISIISALLSLTPCVLTLVYLNRQSELAEGMCGEQGWNQWAR